MFCKSEVVRVLDKNKDMALMFHSQILSKYLQGWLVRKKMKGVREVAKELKAWGERNRFYTCKGSEHTATAKLGDAAAIEKEMKAFVLVMEKGRKVRELPFPNEHKLKTVHQRMTNEHKLLTELKGYQTSVDHLEISNGLARAKDLELPGVADIAILEKREEALKVQIPLCKVLKEAVSEEEVEDALPILNKVMDRLVQEGLAGPEGWIKELACQDLLKQIDAMIKRIEEAVKKRLAEEEAKRKAEEEKKRKIEEENARLSAEERKKAEARQKAEEDARKKKEEEEQAKAKEAKEAKEKEAKAKKDAQAKKEAEEEDTKLHATQPHETEIKKAKRELMLPDRCISSQETMMQVQTRGQVTGHRQQGAKLMCHRQKQGRSVLLLFPKSTWPLMSLIVKQWRSGSSTPGTS